MLQPQLYVRDGERDEGLFGLIGELFESRS